MMAFDGLSVNLANIHRLSDAQTRSISPENLTGEKGKGGMATEGTGAAAARELGHGWKVSPSVNIEAGETFSLADIAGPGAIQHIWMTPNADWRRLILHIYWDDQEQPSVACPIGDFFANAFGSFENFMPLNSMAVCVNPGSALNCYWPMPFRRRCRMTLTNLADKAARVYYQIDYALNEVAEDAAYFHAQFRRVNPLPYKEIYTILDGVRGQGHYAGTYMAWGVNNNRWWGEGEIKFYLDGDWPEGKQPAERGGDAYPTICGTGTEDYFCGSYNFENRRERRYQEFCTPYAGMPQVVRPDGLYVAQQRFGLYRWHIPDPVRFKEDIQVTMQALGWRSGGRYLPLQDDIASVAYWYQTLPTAPFPALPDADGLELI